MNIPQVYLVEPYNAYSPKQKKKHWHQVVEEEALMARIMAEQQIALATQQQALLEASSKTLPPNSPDTSTPTVVGIPAAGGGGMPVYAYFAQGGEVVEFSGTPVSGAAPLTVQFTNLTPTPQFDSYTWNFGDAATSNDVNPVHVYQTSSATFDVSLTASHDKGDTFASKLAYISSSIPVVTAAFTFITTSKVAPFSASFTNTTQNTSQTPTTNYLWKFQYDNGTTASFTTTNASTRVDTGSFTASLQATGSYGIASKATTMFVAPAPTFTVTDTYVTYSNASPMGVTFLAPTITNTGHGIVSGMWHSGELKEDLTEWVQDPYNSYAGYSNTYVSRSYTGQDRLFTASLQLVESSYGITATWTASFKPALPTIVAAFTVAPGGGPAPSLETFTNTTVYSTGSIPPDSLIYRWQYGSGSLTSAVETAPALTYKTAMSYTASLQVTESVFGVKSNYTQSWTVV